MDAISYSHSVKQEKRIKKFNTNPDSNSGVLTQPKVIEAGETVTIKSGRQAILADTVVDGELVIEAGGEVFVPAGAGFGDLDQRIDTKLDKDFSSFTDKPTPVDTDNLVLQEVGGLLKKLSFSNLMTWIKSFSFGWNQTWQDVTASRNAGVTYTNNTGKPIIVHYIFREHIDSPIITFKIDNVIIPISDNLGSYAAQYANLTIPVNSTYLLSAAGSTLPGGNKWHELR